MALLHKKVTVRWLLVIIWLGVLITVVFGALVRHQLLGGKKLGVVGVWAVKVAAYPKEVKDAVQDLFGFNQQILPNKNTNIKGLVYFIPQKDTAALLTTVYNPQYSQTAIQLINLNNGTIVHQWLPPLKAIRSATHNQNPFFYSNILNATRARALHPLLLPDGSVIAKINEGPLFRLDTNNHLLWLIDGVFHHSTEIDADGNIWTPTVLDTSFIPESLANKNRNDAIACISPQGKVLLKESVAQILMDNGYKALLLGTSEIEEDPLHLNEIKPALYSSKYWQKGDLLISLRHKSTVFLYRLSTHKIIWLKTGPWLNQHCPDFVDSTHISVFGNNIIRTFALGGDKLFKKNNEVYLYNFANDSITKPFSKVFSEKSIGTLTEGRAKILPNGTAFVEETNFGRAFRVSPTNVLWEFKYPIDDTHISMLSWGRYLFKKGEGKYNYCEN
ncbi:arylsulfotransferase family protein [Hydrotalea sp.]|uniref:arylsulfotransferase family protein n=1 Tax=Hydrotalea sp. TaxID=2881279 RepID=UPI003D135298